MWSFLLNATAMFQKQHTGTLKWAGTVMIPYSKSGAGIDQDSTRSDSWACSTSCARWISMDSRPESLMIPYSGLLVYEGRLRERHVRGGMRNISWCKSGLQASHDPHNVYPWSIQQFQQVPTIWSRFSIPDPSGGGLEGKKSVKSRT